jgi:glycosyltransferase involved in cell wall biosynthesis
MNSAENSGPQLPGETGQVKTTFPARIPQVVGMNQFLSSASFRAPERIVLSAWHEHAPFVFWLVEQHKPNLFVELGTHGGFSYFAVCQAIRMADLATAAFAIDHWTGDEHTGSYGEEVYESVAAFNAARYSDFSTLMKMSFADSVQYFDDGSIDLLHLDGRHFYEDVKEDFAAWLPKLSDRAVVLFHDTNVRERGFGVHRFWSEISREFPHFVFHHGHGLGVIGLGANHFPALKALFEASVNPRLASGIRNAYARLGSAITSEFRLAEEVRMHASSIAKCREFESTLRANEGELQQARVREAELTQGAEKLGSECFRLADMVDRLKTQLTDQAGMLAASRKENEQLRGERVAFSQKISELDESRQQIVILQRNLDKALAELSKQHQELSEQGHELENRQSNLVALRRAVSALEERLAHQVDAIAQFSHKLAEARAAEKQLQISLQIARRKLQATKLNITQLSPLRWLRARLVTRSNRKVIRASGLFDQHWYLQTYQDLARNIDPALHYLKVGALEGRDPHPLFDTKWYLQNYPDVEDAGINPLVHYLLYGVQEGRYPNPLFDTVVYLEQNPDVKASGINPLDHYIRWGAAEGRNPHPLFDTSWYLQQYADVAVASINPLAHYLRHGASERRDPNPLFDTNWYLQQYPNVGAEGINPLVHYIRYGVLEQRNPNSLFDTAWYCAHYLDVQTEEKNPLVDYLQKGALLGRNPSKRFDGRRYLEENSDVREAAINPLAHYLRFGINEGRAAKPSSISEPPVIRQLSVDHYSAWLERNELTEVALQALRDAISAKEDQLPLISIIMPVYNTPGRLLDEAIQSVVDQVYQNWELCIADDASTDPEISRALQRWTAADPRIRVVKRHDNGGIARATNSAADIAMGELLAFLDHDDLLTTDALATIAIYASAHPEADLIYSDEDKIEMSGRRFAPQFKPDWSPTLLLSYMYIGHLFVIRRELFRRVGGIRTGFEGSQDYDLALRASEAARSIGHIPRILYHWRMAPGSVAASTDEKPHSLSAGLKAVTEAFTRRGIEANVDQADWARVAKIGVYSPTYPDHGPRVSIIVPTRNQPTLLKTCILSIAKTTYQNYEVVIVDNCSDDPETLAYLKDCRHRVLRVANTEGSFSFSHMNNVAVNQVQSAYILMLNNDTEVLNPRWLSQMMGYAQMQGVGAVGAKLLYRNGAIQHNGIVHGYNDGTVGHAFKNVADDGGDYLSYLTVARECSGVTAACLLTPRSLFIEKGGLDTVDFNVAYNDVDYCCRLLDDGLRCIICPDATLYHEEGRTRGYSDNPKELVALRRRYRGRVDPWYNQNLSLDNEAFEIQPHRYPFPIKRNIRIVAVTHNLNQEGAPKILLDVLTELHRQGTIDPIVISPHEGPLRLQYETAGIQVLVLSPNIGDADKFAETRRLFGQLFRGLKADVVHANSLHSFWCTAAAEAEHIPAVWTVHESESSESFYDFLPSDVRAEAYASFRHPYRVIFVSHASRRVWERFDIGHNFKTIQNGLNLNRLLGYQNQEHRIRARAKLGIGDAELALILLGTVCERKGQLDLVRALKVLSPSVFARLRVFIVGDRPSSYSDQLHREASSLSVDARDRLMILPETGEPYEFLSASDIAICCSRVESYPLVTMEAMAFNLPLITTPVFGIAEQVRNEVNGLFYLPGDVADLAQKITRLTFCDALRAQLAANSSFVLASLPSFEDQIESYSRIYQEARLSSGPASR